MRRPIKPTRVLSGARSAGRLRAATLIELLVVIALIGMLMVTMIPSLRRSMEMASATVCKHNLDQLGKVLAMYRLENDGWLPMGSGGDIAGQITDDATPEEREAMSAWFADLFPTYMTDPFAVTCPADPFRYRMSRVNGNMHDPRVADFASFGINGFIMNAGQGQLARIERRGPTRPLDTILLADIGPDDSRPAGSRQRGPGPFRNSSLIRWDDGYDPFDVRPGDAWLTDRHGKGIHALTLSNQVREAQTIRIMAEPMRPFYSDCSSGGCTFCNDLRLYHYSFARDHLFWWTGPTPTE